MTENNSHSQTDTSNRGLTALAGAVNVTLRALFIAVGLLLLITLLQCYVIVKPHQVGIVYRFGEKIRELKAGEHGIVLPEPIDEFMAYDLSREKVLETDAFQYALTEADKLTGTLSAPGQTLRTGVDGYLLTGDRNIVHCRASLSYRVHDPIAFYEMHNNPEAVLTALFHTAMVQATATVTTHETLFDITAYRECVRRRLTARIDKLDLGITVSRIVLKPAAPRQVKDAFDEHLAARQNKDELLKQAEAYRERTLNETQSAANRILTMAKAEKTKMVETARAREDTFTELLKHYRENRRVLHREAYVSALRKIASNADESYVIHPQPGREIRIQLGKQKSRSTPEASPEKQ